MLAHDTKWATTALQFASEFDLIPAMQSNFTSRRLALLGIGLIFSIAASRSSAADPAAAAFQAAIAKNIDHAREYLEQKDFKSLAQSTNSINLLAELLKARGDDAEWRAAIDRLLSSISALQKAGQSDDAAACRTAIDQLTKVAAATESISPKGQPQSLSRVPPIRSLMLTMDATAGEAKIALLTGNVEAAKKQAHVLSELARLVSNSRATPEWPSLAGDFEKATQAVASTTETDSKAVRQLLRNALERCDACHEKNRTR